MPELEDRMLVINYSRMPMFNVTYTDGNPAIPEKNGAGVLWRNWRLLENRELYDINSDPHQDHDVAAGHPEVFQKMSNHLEEWWKEVENDVMEVQRIIIGNDAENPMMITACEWLNVFVDQQVQIRRGAKKNGIWHVIIDREGEYIFELRRWPRESGFALNDGIEETKVTDGMYVAGPAMDIKSARVRIGDQEGSANVGQADQAVTFEFHLQKGETTIQTWFDDSNGDPVCGAYYVYVERL
jgi:hypothetical protein